MDQKAKKWDPRSLGIAIAFVLIFAIGVGLMMYPMIVSRYSEAVRSEIQTSYEDVLSEVDTSEIDAIRTAANEYNNDLFTGAFSRLDFKENGYYEQLKLPNTEVMCYVSIPKINVYLPVYHGVGTESLEKGAGHMEQSSLPVGGINTHAVISAHTGMARSPMFSDLELLKIGDIFQIHVLGETMTYEVAAIDVVLPQDVDTIQIQRERDLASLVTCTPYGINTHRLVVCGQRIENPEEEILETMPDQEQEDTGSVWADQYWKSVKIGVFIALGIICTLVILFVFAFLQKKRETRGRYESE